MHPDETETKTTFQDWDYEQVLTTCLKTHAKPQSRQEIYLNPLRLCVFARDPELFRPAKNLSENSRQAAKSPRGFYPILCVLARGPELFRLALTYDERDLKQKLLSIFGAPQELDEQRLRPALESRGNVRQDRDRRTDNLRRQIIFLALPSPVVHTTSANVFSIRLKKNAPLTNSSSTITTDTASISPGPSPVPKSAQRNPSTTPVIGFRL